MLDFFAMLVVFNKTFLQIYPFLSIAEILFRWKNDVGRFILTTFRIFRFTKNLNLLNLS